ncbi:MAG: type II CAAX endopeptidase family protein [Candidatus Sulfotelmatobacter sp.]
MPDESGPPLAKELNNESGPGRDSNLGNAGGSGQRKSSWRNDRIRLLIWAGIAFAPLALILGLHLGGKRNNSVLTVETELPIKAAAAFFVWLATWVVSRVEKRSLADYGIPPGQAFGKRFWEGAVWGFAMLSAILLAQWGSGHFQIDSVGLAGGAVLRWGLAWGVTFLAVSLHEELAFRGYWLFTMSRRIRFWPAALFLSAVFGAAHLGNHGENVLGILQVVVTGLLFCLMIRRTGNLWFAIGFHAAWDWAETFFYGTPDSGLLGVGRFLNTSVHGANWITGGSAGPEGSIFAMVVLVMCAGLVHLRFPRAVYPDRPE